MLFLLMHLATHIFRRSSWTLSQTSRPCPQLSSNMVLQNDIDLLNLPVGLEKRKHKLKRLVPSPNSCFLNVKCQGCSNMNTVYSHSQTAVECSNCKTILCQPTGGKARLMMSKISK